MEEAIRRPEILSDEDVVARVRDGEVDLFEVLLRRYNQRLYRVARSVVRDDARAEDIVQETWVRAFEHLHQFENRSRFSTWLKRIALHESWARARNGRKFVSIDPGSSGEVTPMCHPVSSDTDPERRASDRETAIALEAAIAALPDRYRGVFVLREVEELSTAETAECLELTEETVKTRLHRARGLLRRELEGPSARAGVYPFLGPRCDRMVASVLARIRPASAAGAN